MKMKVFNVNVFWIFTFYIDASSAFKSDTAKFLSAGRWYTIPNRIYAINKNNSNEPQPQPPNFYPKIDEQLEMDLMESQRRIMLYEKEVEMIREQLELKEDELLEEQNIFRDERKSLLRRIEDFTKTLAQKDDELVAAVAAEATSANEKFNDLEKKIGKLQQRLKEKMHSLETQKQTTDEIRKRFENAEDSLEFEQMNFEEERKALQKLVAKERKQVEVLTEKFEENSRSFKKARDELEKKIEKGEIQLKDSKTKWKETQAELQQIENKLQITLREKSQILKENVPKNYIDDLNDQIKKDQTDIKEMKKKLEEKNNLMRESSEILQAQIASDEKKIKELKTLLSDEKGRFYDEKTVLDAKIKNLNVNLVNVELQLANEKAAFSKEKKMLEEKLAKEIRTGKLKKKQMKKRYDQIRTEMTNLWESSKRQARQEENRLRRKYNRKLDVVKLQVAKLEEDLKLEKCRLNETKIDLESKHIRDLEVRDTSIARLEADVVNLRKAIVDKDQIIREKNKQIKNYETSFRQLARLGVKVTGNKVRKITGPFKKMIQNEPPPMD